MSYIKRHYNEAKEYHNNQAIEIESLAKPILEVFGNGDKLHNLKKIISQSEDNTLVLGAGVSVAAGIPDWNGIVGNMVGDMLNKRFIANTPAASQAGKEDIYSWLMKEAGSPLMKIRYVQLHYSDSNFYRAVHKNIYMRECNSETPLLDAIATLVGSHFRRIITYNFDDLLEQVLTRKNMKYISIDSAIIEKENTNYIYHVHGLLRQSQIEFDNVKLVFSEEQYHEIYNNPYSWSNIIQLANFMERTCLFVGSSLSDPNLRRLLDTAKNIGGVPHFALLKRSKPYYQTAQLTWEYYQLQEDYFRTLGINVIWITDYNEIPIILRWLGFHF